MIPLTMIVEDSLSDAVARKMLEETNKNYVVYNALRWDKNKIKKGIKELNKAAQGHAYFVLTDQDTEDRCPPTAIRELPEPIHPNLLYRFAVMEIESWVMAHREAISKFLSTPVNRIPVNTDTIGNPKEHLIKIARKSKSAAIRRDIVPASNSTSSVGPDYNARLGEFVRKHWDVEVASNFSPSLQRAFKRLAQFTQHHSV